VSEKEKQEQMRVILTNKYGRDEIQKVWHPPIQEIIKLLMKAAHEYDIMTICKCLTTVQRKISKLIEEEVHDLADRFESAVFLSIWVDKER